MIVKKLRLQHGWSQEQLSQFSGLSVRTIQRIERGHKAGLESLKSLAAVFEVELNTLQQETDMTISTSDNNHVTLEEKRAMEYVQNLKDFYSHLAIFSFVVTLLFILNYVLTPSYIWAWWVLLGWGIGIVSHGLSVFDVINFFDADWEKRQIEKRLGRDL